MLLLEDVGRLVLWLTLLVVSLNLVFLFFLIYRRIVRKHYFSQKDSARERYLAPVSAFVGGELPLEQAAALLQSAKRSAEREVLYRMLFTASTAETSERISDLLFRLGYAREWSRVAFGRRASSKLIELTEQRQENAPRVRRSILLQPLYQMRFMAVPRAIAVYNLGRLSPRHAHLFLSAALTDPSPQVRRVAIEHMGRNRYPQALPQLLDELQKAVEEENDISLRSLKTALIRFRLQDLEIFLPLLASPSRRARFFVIDSIRQICERAAAQSQINRGDFPPALCQVVLEKCQFDEFEDVRARSAYVVKHFRDQSAIAMLRALVRDANEFVRLHALRACSDIFFADLIPDLLARLKDERWRVREAAVQALHAMEARGRNALFSFFADSTDQFAAEQSCDEFQRKGLVPEVVAAIYSGGEAGALAQRVASKMVSMGKTSVLFHLLTSSTSFAVRSGSMDALATNPDSEFLAVLGTLSLQDTGEIGAKARQLLQRIQSGAAAFASSAAAAARSGA